MTWREELAVSSYKKHFSQWGWLTVALAVMTTTVASTFKPALAEGSRNLYPATAIGSRGNLEWQPSASYFTNPSIKRQTLLKVYARQGENILLGSSAVGVGSGDAVIYAPGSITGNIGAETLPPTLPGTPAFSCNNQRTITGVTARGRITTRNQELAGPQAILGTGNTTGYIPCFYTAPADGIYDVIFYGTTGSNPASPGAPTGEIALSSANNFNNTQGSTVAAWDVTVRSSDTNSTTDLNGRLFTYYVSLFTGSNNRPVYSTLYPITTDGYRYSTNFNGIDPNGWIFYGNRVGFLDPDGKTPLYHDVISNANNDNQLNNLVGGVLPVRPEFPIFFTNTLTSPEVNTTLAAIVPPTSGTPSSLPPLPSSIPLTPTAPIVNNFSFTGTAGANNSVLNTGGTFRYDANVSHTYQIVISRNGVNFDPTNSSNRVLRGLNSNGAGQTVSWDGKDNAGNPFPIGQGYQVRMQIQAGEYHFPLLDVENSPTGGPSNQLLNPPGSCTLTGGCAGGFYDDRGYRLSNGTTVGTVGSVLPGGNVPPSPANSDPINGFNTSSNQRKFGDNGFFGWGNQKGLDLWTYFPSAAQINSLNIVGTAPDLNIKKSHTGNFIVGKQGSYKLTVANKATGGPINNLNTDPVTVTDTLPAGLTFVSATGTGWNCSAAGQVVTCNYNGATPIVTGAILPDITITVNVTAAAAVPGGVANSATVSTPQDTPNSATGNDNTATDPTNVLVPPTFYKSVKFIRDNNGNNALNVGDDVQYTLIIENPNTNALPFSDIVVKDTIPVQLQVLRDAANPIAIATTNNAGTPDFTLASNFPSGSFNGTGNSITFTNPGTLAPGGRVTVTFNTRILPGAASPITNQGSVNYQGDGGTPTLTDASDTNNPTAPGSNVNPGEPGTGTNNNISQPNASQNDPTILNFVSDVNPVGTKSVRLVVDADESGTTTAGDTVEYTVTYLNNNPNSVVDNLLVTDTLDSTNLSFVPGSYSFQSFNGTAATNNTTTVTGNPNYNGTTDINLTNPTVKGQLGAGNGRVAIAFRAVVKASTPITILNQAIATSTASPQGAVTQSQVLTDAISGPSDVPQPLGNNSDQTQLPVVASGPPRLRLVKRITNVTRNGNTIGGINFGSYVSVNADDTASGWSQLSPVGVATIPSTIPIESGDEVEYTIYYLSDGSGTATNIKVCDIIPAGTTFSPNSFSNGSGISWNRSGIVRVLSNAADADEGTFFSPLAPLPTGNTCQNQTNPDGAAIVNLGNIPNAGGRNYGFVRFRVQIK